MALPDDPAGRYLAVSDMFTGLVAGTADWDAPSPVSEWTARDVVWHLVDWVPDVLRDGASLDIPQRDVASNDPMTDWARFDAAMRAIVARPDIATLPFSHPRAGTMTAGVAIDMLVTPDIYMHSWDLARATGQPVTLDPDYAATLLAGLEGIEEMLRASGHYGQRVAVHPNADVTARLIGFIGRDPNWEPPRRPGVATAPAAPPPSA